MKSTIKQKQTQKTLSINERVSRDLMNSFVSEQYHKRYEFILHKLVE